LREVLRNLPAEGEEEEDRDWGDDWRKFLAELNVPAEPDEPTDEESRENWVEEAVERFTSLRRFAELVRTESTRAEPEHA
jgi:hypothetical protein